MPFLSIIVPVYNVEKYLSACIESILTQGYTDYELILIDDGSTDSSGLICDQFAKYERVNVIHQNNKGSLLARRKGFQVAKGLYVLCADADDYYLPNAFGQIYETISKSNSDLMVFDYIYGAGQGKPERVIRVCPQTKRIFKGQDVNCFREQLVTGRDFNSLCCKVVRRSCIDIDADYTAYAFVANGDDSFQSLPILDKVSSIAYLSVPLYYYRRDNISQSKHYGRKDYKSFMCVYSRTIEYIEKWGFDDTIKQNARNSFLKHIMTVVLQARKECSQEEYCKFLNSIVSDFGFQQLMSNQALDNKYADTVLFLLRKKMIRIAVLFIDAVNIIKNYN